MSNKLCDMKNLWVYAADNGEYGKTAVGIVLADTKTEALEKVQEMYEYYVMDVDEDITVCRAMNHVNYSKDYESILEMLNFRDS